MTPEQMEKAVYDRCVEVRKYGIQIGRSLFGVMPSLGKFARDHRYPRVCPLGACLLNAPFPRDSEGALIEGLTRGAAYYFGISYEDAWDFIDGVDGLEGTNLVKLSSPYYQAGKRVAAKLGLPID